MEMTLKTNIVQVTNVAPVATLEQMSTLFGFLGKILDIKLYPSDDYIFQPTSRVCYVHFADSWSVGVAQHLTNTVFIDRALIVVPLAEDTIPDETKAMALTSPSASVPSVVANSPVISQVTGVGASQVIQTMDPRLSALGLPQYPPLPANMDPLKVEEIRRTVYVGNLDSTLTAEQLLKFFNQIGEVKYVRMAGDETQPTRFAFVEFTDQSSVASALQYNGVIYGGRPLKINHSNNAIVKPQAKSSEAAQREIEEAMKRVREAQSLITAAIEPELVEKKSDRSRSRSRSRRRSGSRSHKRSRSRSNSRKSSRRRSRSRHRSRSRRHRSRSRDHKSRSRSKERKKRSVSPRPRREKSRSRSSERSKKRHRKSRSRSRSKSSTRSKTSASSKTKESHKSEKKLKDKSKEKSPKKEKSSKKEIEKEVVKPKVEPPDEKPDISKIVVSTSNEELGPPVLTPEIPFKDPNNFVKLETEDTGEKIDLEKRVLPQPSENPETTSLITDIKEEPDDTPQEDEVDPMRSPPKEPDVKSSDHDVDLRLIKPVEKVVVKKEPSSSPRHKSRSPSRASRSPSYTPRSVSKRHSRSPSKRRSRSPIKKWSRSPSKRRSKTPAKKRSRSPVRRASRSPSKRPSRSPSRKRSCSRSRKRSRTPTKLSRRRISPSLSPVRRRSRSPRRRRSRSSSRVYPRKRRISRSPRRRSRTPRRRSRSPSYRRRSRGPRRSRTPVRRRRSPSRTSRTPRLSRSPRRRSRTPRRRSRTRSRSASSKRDSRHKKRKDKDRDRSRDRDHKKRRREEKERSGSSSKDMKVVRNYDEEEKGYDSGHEAEGKRISSGAKPRDEDRPKPPVDSDASDRRSGDMDLDSD